jgi:stalled ribosome rescue protein Dom34
METTKNFGIWMDHSKANFIDLNPKKGNHSIDSKFTFSVKEEALNRSEDLMHNKKQQMHKLYYKKIGDEILKYDHVLLFGPTNAKTELHNFLNENSHFKDIKIDVEPADKLSENEKIAFVKKHFEV